MPALPVTAGRVVGTDWPPETLGLPDTAARNAGRRGDVIAGGGSLYAHTSRFASAAFEVIAQTCVLVTNGISMPRVKRDFRSETLRIAAILAGVSAAVVLDRSEAHTLHCPTTVNGGELP